VPEHELRTNYVLIDFENVHVKSLDLLTAEHFKVMVFLGPKNTKLPVDLVLAMQNFGARAEYVQLETAGTNALDFHVAFHLGRLAATDPTGFFHIISKDTGFDPLVQHLKTRNVFSARSASIEGMPCFRTTPAASLAPPPSPPEPATPSPPNTTPFDELCAKVIAHLRNMKHAKPAKQATLHSTIRTKLGKDVPASTADMICSELVKRGHLKLNGAKVLYSLPAIE
jgi:hypothetical protein